ncbi:unnamed protein product [Lampetra fluviatilis]
MGNEQSGGEGEPGSAPVLGGGGGGGGRERSAAGREAAPGGSQPASAAARHVLPPASTLRLRARRGHKAVERRGAHADRPAEGHGAEFSGEDSGGCLAARFSGKDSDGDLVISWFSTKDSDGDFIISWFSTKDSDGDLVLSWFSTKDSDGDLVISWFSTKDSDGDFIISWFSTKDSDGDLVLSWFSTKDSDGDLVISCAEDSHEWRSSSSSSEGLVGIRTENGIRIDIEDDDRGLSSTEDIALPDMQQHSAAAGQLQQVHALPGDRVQPVEWLCLSCQMQDITGLVQQQQPSAKPHGSTPTNQQQQRRQQQQPPPGEKAPTHPTSGGGGAGGAGGGEHKWLGDSRPAVRQEATGTSASDERAQQKQQPQQQRAAEESVTGKLFGYGASLLSQASNLIGAVNPAPSSPPAAKAADVGAARPAETRRAPGTSTQGPQQRVHGGGGAVAAVPSAVALTTPRAACPRCRAELSFGTERANNGRTCAACGASACAACGSESREPRCNGQQRQQQQRQQQQRQQQQRQQQQRQQQQRQQQQRQQQQRQQQQRQQQQQQQQPR